VWSDGVSGTGGGFSSYFAKPAWQTVTGTGRMVPDVAALADPATGYSIYLDGRWTTIGGTSAAAPLWAGLMAAVGCAAAKAGRPALGDLHSWLWSHPEVFSDITTGNNGAYKAAVGPDPCTGLGAPVGASILEAVLATIAGPPVPPPVKPPDPPPTKPPEPPVSQSFTINVPQQPVMIFGQKLGYVPAHTLTGKVGSADAAVEPAVSVPPDVWAAIDKYGLPALRIVIAGRMAGKSWAAIGKDLLGLVIAGSLAA
jgi:hypothetical protein